MKTFRIKLKRRGSTKQPVYDLVVVRNINRVKLDVLEIVGSYSLYYPAKYAFLNVERLAMWCLKGATLSTGTLRLLTLLYSCESVSN